GGTPTSVTSLQWIPAHDGVVAFMVHTPAAMDKLSKALRGDIFDAPFGFRRPRVDVPDERREPLRLERYLGAYENLEISMEVTRGEGENLNAQLTWRRDVETPAAFELLR